MDRATARGRRRSRSLVVLILALALVAVFGIAAQQAMAFQNYEHGTATVCSSCHPGGNVGTPPTTANCTASGCHTGYAVPDPSKTCWTCHTPGQDMSAVKSGAPAICTTACHLANGTTITHVAHPDKPTTCTTCHPLTASFNNANGSWHHTARVVPPVTPAISIKASASSVKVKKPITISGKVTPTSLNGKSVKITIQMKSGTKWKTITSKSAKISATGAYSYKYTPTKKGTYQAQGSMAAVTGFNAGKSPWKSFKVK